MKFNLKNRPETVFSESSFTKWFEGFEKRQRLIHSEPQNWLDSHKIQIVQRFQHHSIFGLTLEELLTYFIEEEILGEEK